MNTTVTPTPTPSATATSSATVRLEDGTRLAWEGFNTGPLVYDGDFSEFRARLLGMAPQDVVVQASRRLVPHRASAQGGSRERALVVHSATSAIKLFEGDVSELAAGRSPYDCATYLEARAVFLARPGDLVVGRTAPWREAVRVFGIDSVDLGDLDHYYLSQALLAAAVRYEDSSTAAGVGTTSGSETALSRIIAWMRRHPTAVVRMYALDREMQIFLLWLLRRTGLESVRVDANNYVVSTDWNRKRHIHPLVADAEALSATGMSPEALLAAEQRLAESYRRIRLVVPVLPGYTIERTATEPEEFADQAVRAACLLRRRYGLRQAFLKPSESGGGTRIVGPVALEDLTRLRAAAVAAHHHGDDYLVEAAVDYLHLPGSAPGRPVAPSGHIRNGEVAPGLTLQFLDRFSWEGNAYVDRVGWERTGLPVALYDRMREAMRELHEAFLGDASAADGSQGGLVTGGVDFAVGRVGGVFGDRLFAAAIDFNLSSNGAEFLRAFHEEIVAENGPEQYVATRVFRPAATATHGATRAAVQTAVADGHRADVVACVPKRWGMVTVAGSGLPHAVQRAEDLVRKLVEMGLATDQG